jgi:hypothetical protein
VQRIPCGIFMVPVDGRHVDEEALTKHLGKAPQVGQDGRIQGGNGRDLVEGDQPAPFDPLTCSGPRAVVLAPVLRGRLPSLEIFQRARASKRGSALWPVKLHEIEMAACCAVRSYRALLRASTHPQVSAVTRIGASRSLFCRVVHQQIEQGASLKRGQNWLPPRPERIRMAFSLNGRVLSRNHSTIGNDQDHIG